MKDVVLKLRENDAQLNQLAGDRFETPTKPNALKNVQEMQNNC